MCKVFWLALLSAFMALPVSAQARRPRSTAGDCFITGTCFNGIIYQGLKEPIIAVGSGRLTTIYHGLDEPILILNTDPTPRRPAYRLPPPPPILDEIIEPPVPISRITGIDKSGNAWIYYPSTGYYWNSNGTVCTGRGAARICR
jgi:hypothetical protein